MATENETTVHFITVKSAFEVDDEKYDIGNNNNKHDDVSTKQIRGRHFMVSLMTFMNTWIEWTENTTLHGIKYIFHKDVHIIRRIIWFAFVSVVMYGLISICMQQTNRYIAHNPIAKESLSFNKKLEFPAVTFCNLNNIRNDSVANATERDLLLDLLFSQYGINITELNAKYGESYLRNFTLLPYYRNGGTLVDDMFYQCLWEGAVIDCKEHLTGRITADAGYCYTFNSDKVSALSTSMTDSSFGLDIILNANQSNYYIAEGASAGFKVLVHDRNEEPNMHSSTAVSPGFAYFIAVDKHEYKYLPYPVKAFGEEECIDTNAEDFESPLLYSGYSSYSVFACTTECRNTYIFEKCGCVGPLDTGFTNECNALQMAECYYSAKINFTKNDESERCYCPGPCDVTKFDTKVSFAYYPNDNTVKQVFRSDVSVVRSNFLRLKIYYESKIVTMHEQIEEFTQYDLYASFGGFLGLAVGASVMSLMEIMDQLCIALLQCFQRK